MEAAPLIGVTLGGRYRISALIGRGGAGDVYEALQEDLSRKVAVKVLHGSLALDPAWTKRMQREARTVAALQHPNIVQVTDFQLTPHGLPFIVMERLVGRSLRELIAREAPIAAARVVSIAVQALSALSAAHQAGLVHRDVKPENLFLVKTPAVTDFVKVLDFGIAKDDSGVASLTRHGMVLGTLGYMAPEQSRGEAVDARADVFAVGACMYEALVGRLAASDARTSDVVAARVVHAAAMPLAELRADLDPRLSAIVMRALAPEADARFPSADAMIAALEALEVPPAVRTDSSVRVAAAPPLAIELAHTAAAPPVHVPSGAISDTGKGVVVRSVAAPPPVASSGSRAALAVLVLAVTLCAFALTGLGASFVQARRPRVALAKAPWPALPARTPPADPPVHSSEPPKLLPPREDAPEPPKVAPARSVATRPHASAVASAPSSAPPAPPAPSPDAPRMYSGSSARAVVDGVTSAELGRKALAVANRCYDTTEVPFGGGEGRQTFTLTLGSDGAVRSVQTFVNGEKFTSAQLQCLRTNLATIHAPGVCTPAEGDRCEAQVTLRTTFH